MDAEAIAEVLNSLGWEAEVVDRAEVPDLLDVDEQGMMKCVDGRMSDHPDGMRGPKTLGGVYAIASSRGVGDLAGLQTIVKEVAEAGYVPSVHGDEHAEPASMGCGFFKLWVTGQLDGLEPPAFDAEQGRAAVVEAGGVYEQLEGDHAESVVMINLVEGTTLAPAAEQRFVVDAWVLGQFEIDAGPYLARAAETVTKLNGPKVARIIKG
ncbi:MAG: cadmium-containing carbonic anhydrase [Myxococcales bacterium]|nr:cadmium-containing carbonic anhydrase [Myxococcales bacterium]MDD9969471.1 cadmium-containing carbonic anhydrase [Myxococcales bacterium]